MNLEVVLRGEKGHLLGEGREGPERDITRAHMQCPGLFGDRPEREQEGLPRGCGAPQGVGRREERVTLGQSEASEMWSGLSDRSPGPLKA